LFAIHLVCFTLQDDENTTELTPTHHMLQPPQAVFPPCICAAVLPIVHLMEDGGVREDGVAGERQRRIFRQTILPTVLLDPHTTTLFLCFVFPQYVLLLSRSCGTA